MESALHQEAQSPASGRPLHPSPTAQRALRSFPACSGKAQALASWGHQAWRTCCPQGVWSWKDSHLPTCPRRAGLLLSLSDPLLWTQTGTAATIASWSPVRSHAPQPSQNISRSLSSHSRSLWPFLCPAGPDPYRGMWVFSSLLLWEGTRLGLSLSQTDGPCLLWGGELKTLGLLLGWLWEPQRGGSCALVRAHVDGSSRLFLTAPPCPVAGRPPHSASPRQASFSPLPALSQSRKERVAGSLVCPNNLKGLAWAKGILLRQYEQVKCPFSVPF